MSASNGGENDAPRTLAASTARPGRRTELGESAQDDVGDRLRELRSGRPRRARASRCRCVFDRATDLRGAAGDVRRTGPHQLDESRAGVNSSARSQVPLDVVDARARRARTVIDRVDFASSAGTLAVARHHDEHDRGHVGGGELDEHAHRRRAAPTARRRRRTRSVGCVQQLPTAGYRAPASLGTRSDRRGPACAGFQGASGARHAERGEIGAGELGRRRRLPSEPRGRGRVESSAGNWPTGVASHQLQSASTPRPGRLGRGPVGQPGLADPRLALRPRRASMPVGAGRGARRRSRAATARARRRGRRTRGDGAVGRPAGR